MVWTLSPLQAPPPPCLHFLECAVVARPPMHSLCLCNSVFMTPPAHLQYPLLVLREAIPEPWPRSALLRNLHTLAQLGNSPAPSCESRDHLCSCWTPNPQCPVCDHLRKDFCLGPGTFWGPGPDLEGGLDSLCHYLPV